MTNFDNIVCIAKKSAKLIFYTYQLKTTHFFVFRGAIDF